MTARSSLRGDRVGRNGRQRPVAAAGAASGLGAQGPAQFAHRGVRGCQDGRVDYGGDRGRGSCQTVLRERDGVARPSLERFGHQPVVGVDIASVQRLEGPGYIQGLDLDIRWEFGGHRVERRREGRGKYDAPTDRGGFGDHRLIGRADGQGTEIRADGVDAW